MKITKFRLILFAGSLLVSPATSTFAADVEPPIFSVARGHFDSPFVLEIRASDAGKSIRYTTNGGDPSNASAGSILVGPGQDGDVARVAIPIDGTMSVRAVAQAQNGGYSGVQTHSYIFPGEVLKQTAPNRPLQDWGHSGPDWEMDRDIVEHRDSASRLRDTDLKDIPALYVSLPFDELWGVGGIYLAGEGDRRDASIELLNPAANAGEPNQVPGFQVDATVEVTGGSSTERWKTDKLSLRIRFHHGATFPFLANPGIGADGKAVDRFHTLILDARLNESWTHPSSGQRKLGQYTRDQFIADLMIAEGGLAPRGRHVHLYLAGIYWGVYNLHERPDHHFAASYRGGDSDDWVIVKHNANDVVRGDGVHFQRLWDRTLQPDIDSEQAFRDISEMLDVDDFTRYLLVNFWGGNTDWSYQNWYASFRPGTPDGKWRFHPWDSEHTMEDVNEDVTRRDDIASPTGIHRRLMMNPAYRQRFDAISKSSFAEGGVFHPAKVSALYRVHASEVDAAIRAESARWGDNRRRRPYTRGADWQTEYDRLIMEYLPRRTNVVQRQLEESR